MICRHPALEEHSGQTSAHVRGLSTSGFFPEHTTERTVREFVNEILLGVFFWWMNHHLNDLPRMTEDLCGSKRKKGIQFEQNCLLIFIVVRCVKSKQRHYPVNYFCFLGSNYDLRLFYFIRFGKDELQFDVG